MLRRAATGLARCVHEGYASLAPALATSAGYATAATESSLPSEQDLRTKDVYTILAEMMHKDAAKAKKQDALKGDVTKIISMMEGDLKGVPEMNFQGKLKDLLPTLGQQARNDLFAGILESDDIKKAQPALKNVVAELKSVGEVSRIVEVAYKYMEILDGKATTAAAPLTITMTLAAQEGTKEIDSKKAMLVADMQAKGVIAKEQKLAWKVAIDPSIKGGVVYSIGDLLVDASFKSLQEQFFQSLDTAGIRRID